MQFSGASTLTMKAGINIGFLLARLEKSILFRGKKLENISKFLGKGWNFKYFLSEHPVLLRTQLTSRLNAALKSWTQS